MNSSTSGAGEAPSAMAPNPMPDESCNAAHSDWVCSACGANHLLRHRRRNPGSCINCGSALEPLNGSRHR